MNIKQPLSSLGTDATSPKWTDEIENESTLPNGTSKHTSDRSVMWHEPDPIGSGTRSGVPEAGGRARSVTDGVATPAGAILAGTPHGHTAETGVRTMPAMVQTVTLFNGVETALNRTQVTTSSLDYVEWRDVVMQLSRSPGSSEIADKEWLSTIDDARAFEIVKLGRAFVSIDKQNRFARKDTSPSAATMVDYLKKVALIDRQLADLGDDAPERLWTVMGRHASKKNSFSVYKSALKWRATRRIEELLRSQDALQSLNKHGDSWRRHVVNLLEAMIDFIEIENLTRSVCSEFVGGKGKGVESKRKDLPFLPNEWKKTFLNINETDPKYRDAGVLLCYCGLRPVEISKGVKLNFVPDGINVTVFGGKVRATAGQPWRKFKLNSDLLPVWFVNELRLKKELNVCVSSNALRSHLNRLSDRVFKQQNFKEQSDVVRRKRYVLSAYTFRHSFVTDLKENGWDTESIAAVIGESSAQTVSYYGTRSRPGSKRPPIVALFKNSLVTARPVRPLNMNDLKSLLKTKANSVKKKFQ